jgi:group I intron endonuclease
MGIIYLIVNKINGKVYVGQTIRKLAYRMNIHRHDCRRSVNRPLYRSIKKYGWGAFEVRKIAEASSQKELDNLERLWILALQSADREHGYNLTFGGEHGARTEEVRRRMSESRKGRIPWNKGTAKPKTALPIGSPELSEKFRKIALARKSMPKWVRKKISKTLKKKGCMPPTDKRARGPANPFFGVKFFGKNAGKARLTTGRSNDC